MEIFESALRNILIRSNLVGKRVFFMRAPQAPATEQQTPYMVFFLVGATPYHTMRGPVNLIQRNYQISLFDTSQSRATAIADSLRGYLDTYHGREGNYRIGHCLYELQTEYYENETKLTQVVQEYRIMFSYAPLANRNPQHQPQLATEV